MKKIILDILEILEKNSRMKNVEIARMLNVSEAYVRRIIKKLVEDGIIKRFTIDVDPKKIGYEIVSLVGIDTEPEYILNIIEALKNMPEVKKIYLSTGDHMIIAEIWAKNNEEFSKIIFEKIGKIKGIRKICPSIVLSRVK